MKKKTVAYLFVPGAFVGLENLVPFLVRLKSEGFSVRTVVVDRFMREAIRAVPDYERALSENSKVIHVDFSSKESRFRKVPSFGRYLAVLARLAITPSVAVFTFQPVKGVLDKMLRCVSRVRGRFYVLSKANAPVPLGRFMADEIAMKNPDKKRFLRKKKETQGSEFFGTYLMHSRGEEGVADLLNYPLDRRVIGYPKMMVAWRDYVKRADVAWDPPELARESEIAVVLPLEPDLYYFDPADSTGRFFAEILSAIRKKYPHLLIVLKPKPRPQKSLAGKDDWIGELVRECGDPRVVVTRTPNPFLTHKAVMAVSMGETTALFDYVMAGVPCVEHARYAEGWREIYPNGTYWKEFGLTCTGSSIELEAAIGAIHAGRFSDGTRRRIAELFPHDEYPGAFDAL
jgi:hypothetical protein